jgi:RimJ/RimL family protein N-acetyltransferase
VSANEDEWGWLEMLEPVSDDLVAAVEDGRREYIHRQHMPLLIGESATVADGQPSTAPLIKTQRLTLRPYRREDFHRLCELCATDRSRFIGGPMTPAAVWRGFMNGIGHWPILGMGTWAVDLTATGVCVGEVGLSHPIDYPEPELGWLLFDGHEGNGYATEAAMAAKAYAIDVCRLSSLVSYIDPDNLASQRLAMRLGGQRDNGASTPNGDPCLVYRYDVIRAASTA